MAFMRRRTTLLVSAIAAALVTPARAQNLGSDNYTAIEAMPGQPVQLGYYGSAQKDCSPGPLPTLHITQVPKAGTLTVRRGILTTDKVAGCPLLKTPAQIAFYEARAGSSGTDHLIYEVTDYNGEVGVYDVTIEIKAPVQPSPPPNEPRP